MYRRTLLRSAVGAISLSHSRLLAQATGNDPDPVGPGKIDVLYSGSEGRIIITDSFSYCDERVGTNDVIVGCSYAGATTVSVMLPRGIKAIIGHDAGIGKDQAGIDGLPFCDKLGIPMAAVAGHTASLSNGNSLLYGIISSVNASAAELGAKPGQSTQEAATYLLKARPGRPVTAKSDVDSTLYEMEQMPNGRIFARWTLLGLPDQYANDVFALATHCARVAAEHAFRWNVKGWIANDAGMAKNNSGIEALAICGAKGMPAASVAAMSARIGDALSTYHEGVISAVNDPARTKGVAEGMTAQRALRLMMS